MKPKEKSNSIAKALKILSAFVPNNEEMGTVEISQKLGFHKATVSRILGNLTEYGFLRQNPNTRKFLLGPSVMSLARAANQSLKTNLVQLAKPYIDELRDAVQETAILEVLSGDSAFMAYIAEGHRLVSLSARSDQPDE
ncbi:MAG: helix-turn-helix domain-containing protein [Deltaproteobacteria bacterium]